MKQGIRIISAFFAVLMALCLGATAFAEGEPSVTFEDGKVIVFAPGSVYTSTDLFKGFKGLMPGDKRSEFITVQSKVTECDCIKVYMRAIAHDKDDNPVSPAVLSEILADPHCLSGDEYGYMYDFLKQLHMEVYKGDERIYDDTPDELDGLASPVYLGTLRNGESLQLKAQLVVPLTLGNEYANRIGEVDWVFAAECVPLPPPPPPVSSEEPPPPPVSSEEPPPPPPPSSEEPPPPPPSSEEPTPPPSSEEPPPPPPESSEEPPPPPPSSEEPPPPPPSSEEPPPPPPPRTGDRGMLVYAMPLMLSAAAVFVLIAARRREQREED